MTKNQLVPLWGLVVIVGATHLAHAQREIDVTGTIVDIGPSTISLRTDDGVNLLADLSPNHVFDGVFYMGVSALMLEVKGTEDAGYLEPGMYVRFPARVERERFIVGDIGEITVFNPAPGEQFGLLPDHAGEEAKKDDEEGIERVIVVGQLKGASRAGNITVKYPDGQIKGKLAEGAAVKVDTTDHRFARRGDKIHAEGVQIRPPSFFATVISVTLVGDEDKEDARGGGRERGGGVASAPAEDPFKAAATPTAPRPAAPPAARGGRYKGKILKID